MTGFIPSGSVDVENRGRAEGITFGATVRTQLRGWAVDSVGPLRDYRSGRSRGRTIVFTFSLPSLVARLAR